MFKMKKVDTPQNDNQNRKEPGLSNLSNVDLGALKLNPIDQLASSGKKLNSPDIRARSQVSPSAPATSTDTSPETPQTSRTTKLLNALSSSGKKLDANLADKGINLKKETVELALTSLSLASKYLVEKNKKHNYLKHAVKFVVLIPVRPVLIAAGVGVGTYVVVKKVKAHRAARAQLEAQRLEEAKLTPAQDTIDNLTPGEKL